ncbi:hypothetical protein SAMN04487963_3408 [Marinobacter zhejiangensis]|uniref:Uncharacterized protein n=2 Tax=Marinobacter zhejiangensis TaxID=488535 RepID=A0A1I4T007_9GAMM|nr:hypothetical protein SAMN04487963_3408 [Marinobacter zhejiangensis]
MEHPELILSPRNDGGWNQLQVLTPCDNGQQLIWQAELTGSERNILLAAEIDGRNFVVADQAGHVFFGNLDTQQCRKVFTLPVHGIWGACFLDQERQEFWYSATLAKEGATDAHGIQEEVDKLMGWSLPDWQPIADIELPSYIDHRTIVRRTDGCFLYYHSMDGEHGFYRCSPDSGAIELHTLPSHPIPDIHRKERVMAFSPRLGLALLPAMDRITIDAGGARLGYGMQLIDLNSFDILWSDTVRYLAQQASGCNKAEFNCLLKHARGEEVNTGALEDALEELTESLKRVHFCDNEVAFWLGWGDTLQKITLDASGKHAITQRSALYKLQPEPAHFGNQTNPLNHEAYHLFGYNLKQLPDGSLLTIYFGIDQVDLTHGTPCPAPDGSDDEWQQLPCRSLPEPELILTEQQAQAFTNAGKLTIDVNYFALPDELLDGARQLASAMQDIPANAKGQRLELLFCDRDGGEWNERQFVSRTIEVPGVAEQLATAVRLFNAFPDAGFLRSGDSQPALSDTVLALAGHSVDHLPLLAEYFNVIDGEHCAFFHMEHTLPLIEERYGQPGSSTYEPYRQFIQSLPWPFNGEE